MARSYYDDHFDPGADREELRERHQKKREISRPKIRRKGKAAGPRFMSGMTKARNCIPCAKIRS